MLVRFSEDLLQCDGQGLFNAAYLRLTEAENCNEPRDLTDVLSKLGNRSQAVLHDKARL